MLRQLELWCPVILANSNHEKSIRNIEPRTLNTSVRFLLQQNRVEKPIGRHRLRAHRQYSRAQILGQTCVIPLNVLLAATQVQWSKQQPPLPQSTDDQLPQWPLTHLFGELFGYSLGKNHRHSLSDRAVRCTFGNCWIGLLFSNCGCNLTDSLKFHYRFPLQGVLLGLRMPAAPAAHTTYRNFVQLGLSVQLRAIDLYRKGLSFRSQRDPRWHQTQQNTDGCLYRSYFLFV